MKKKKTTYSSSAKKSKTSSKSATAQAFRQGKQAIRTAITQSVKDVHEGVKQDMKQAVDTVYDTLIYQPIVKPVKEIAASGKQAVEEVKATGKQIAKTGRQIGDTAKKVVNFATGNIIPNIGDMVRSYQSGNDTAKSVTKVLGSIARVGLSTVLRKLILNHPEWYGGADFIVNCMNRRYWKTTDLRNVDNIKHTNIVHRVAENAFNTIPEAIPTQLQTVFNSVYLSYGIEAPEDVWPKIRDLLKRSYRIFAYLLALWRFESSKELKIKGTIPVGKLFCGNNVNLGTTVPILEFDKETGEIITERRPITLLNKDFTFYVETENNKTISNKAWSDLVSSSLLNCRLTPAFSEYAQYFFSGIFKADPTLEDEDFVTFYPLAAQLPDDGVWADVEPHDIVDQYVTEIQSEATQLNELVAADPYIVDMVEALGWVKPSFDFTRDVTSQTLQIYSDISMYYALQNMRPALGTFRPKSTDGNMTKYDLYFDAAEYLADISDNLLMFSHPDDIFDDNKYHSFTVGDIGSLLKFHVNDNTPGKQQPTLTYALSQSIIAWSETPQLQVYPMAYITRALAMPEDLDANANISKHILRALQELAPRWVNTVSGMWQAELSVVETDTSYKTLVKYRPTWLGNYTVIPEYDYIKIINWTTLCMGPKIRDALYTTDDLKMMRNAPSSIDRG